MRAYLRTIFIEGSITDIMKVCFLYGLLNSVDRARQEPWEFRWFCSRLEFVQERFPVVEEMPRSDGLVCRVLVLLPEEFYRLLQPACFDQKGIETTWKGFHQLILCQRFVKNVE